jgi:7-cyano-7-deazaguanine synthase
VSRCIVLLSGGVDSASLLALCAEQASDVEALFVDYGQRAIKPERAAAATIAKAYNVTLRHASAGIGAVPKGEIPGRNALLVHLALATAPPGATTIMIGIHAGTTYRDCSPAFVGVMQASLDLHRDGAVQLAAPLVSWTKHEVYAYARAANVPLGITYSCETGTVPPCGTCLSCQDRELLDARA